MTNVPNRNEKHCKESEKNRNKKQKRFFQFPFFPPKKLTSLQLQQRNKKTKRLKQKD